MMNHMNPPESSKSAALLYKLCCNLTGHSGDAVSPSYQFALRVLNSASTKAANVSEVHVTEKIKKKLVRDMREKDVISFADLLRKLKANAVLKNKTAILMFLLELSDSQQDQYQKIPFKHDINIYSASSLYSNSVEAFSSNMKLFIPSVSSPLKSIPNGSTSSNKYPEPSSLPYGYPQSLLAEAEHKQKPLMNGSPSKAGISQNHPGSKVARMITMYGGRDRKPSIGERSKSAHSDTRTIEGTSMSNGELKYCHPSGIKISDDELLRAIIYAFQGIPGKFFVWEPSKNGFQINAEYDVPEPKKVFMLKLLELGSLFLKVHNYCKAKSMDKAIGLVEQSFVGVLQQELMDYYRLLAILEAQVQTEKQVQASGGGSGGLALHKLMVWTYDPMMRMTVLASLVESCNGLKGGALASAVYSYLHHGDPSVRRLLNHILSVVVKPLCMMLSQWLFSGELEDPFLEFFVTTNPVSSSGSLWHERYCLSKSMVPTFLTMNQARKVLSTGKAINFLRQMCNDQAPIHSSDDAKHVFNSNSVESLFSQEDDGEFQTLLERAYQEINHRVLTALHNKYKFMDHLQAMRRYFLLGQGDFIRYLMDMANLELSKPAEEILGHKLHSILEIAIRSTNAQYDDPDILRRLDYYLFQSQIGDTGWDVFSLDYRLDGPIGTVFTPLCKDTYMRLFHSLFRIKRMEYILTSMWKEHMLYSRLLRLLPAVNHVLHRFHILTSVMIHFVQQVQYYIAFEVMECLWAELSQKVRAAKDLDQLISAHEQFLDSILVRALVADQTEVATEKIRDMYNTVLQFQDAGHTFYTEATKIVNLYHQVDHSPAGRGGQENWESAEIKEKLLKEKQRRFLSTSVPKMEKELQTIHKFFEATVNTFLMAVADYEDPNLQFLSFRVDFNNHYKKRNAQLQGSFTYQHMNQLGRRSSSSSSYKK